MPNVTDITGILYFAETSYSYNEFYRWNGREALQTPVIVTYSFLEGADIPVPDFTYSSTQAFNATQRQQFRQALDLFEAAAGIVFVEVASGAPSMVEVYGVSGSGLGGLANIAFATQTYTSSGYLVMDTGAGGNLTSPPWFEVILHEVGHAMGLEHTFEGDIVLDPSVDNTNTTVMSYTDSPGSASDLRALDKEALQFLYGASVDTSGWTFAARAKGITVEGGSGNDTIYGALGENILYGKRGNDTLIGREKHDLLHGKFGTDMLFGENGNDTLRGGRGFDTLHGGNGADVLFGGSSGDTLYGDAGNDLLIGKKGNDTLYGGTGDDALFGNQGDDRLFGGANNDTLHGGAGNDTLTGGTGADTFVFRSFDTGGQDTITDFERGVDTLSIDHPTWTLADAVLSATETGVEFVFEGGGATGFVLDITGLTVAQAEAEWGL